MASGGRFSGSIKGSEETFEYCCTLCERDNKVSEADKQCIECDELFCVDCFGKLHKKIRAMADHTVLDKHQMGKMAAATPPRPALTQLCQTHHGERITTYCSNHDRICCSTCVAVEHKNCDGVTYIVDAAQGIRSGKQLKTTKANVATTLKELKQMKDSRQKYLATLAKDKTANIKQVKEFTDGQIKRLRELEKATVDQINKKDEEASGRARADVAALDDMIAVVEDDLQKLGQGQRSEPQVFVDVKLGQSHEADSRKLLQRTGAAHTPSLKFVPNTSIAQFIHDQLSLGHFADDRKVYKARPQGEYSIKIKQDKNTCNALGSCLLPDGTLLVSDWNNNRLKRLDASYSVTDHCDLPSAPWGVTCTAPGEVAVTMTNIKKVQFISVRGSMSMTRAFTTTDYCRGICYTGGELHVACGGLDDGEEGPGHVAAYSLHGDHLRTIQTDPSGQQIFDCPFHITASPDGSRLYVADYKTGVVALDRRGSRVTSFTDPSLKCAYGLCTLENGHILVCGYFSNNVLQFNAEGRKMAELVKNTDGINKPRSLCFDCPRRRLVVTMETTDIIKVFDLV